MNFKLALAIIGVLLSMAASVQSGGGCAQVIVCDQYGNEYSTPCAFAEAQRENPDLVETNCYWAKSEEATAAKNNLD